MQQRGALEANHRHNSKRGSKTKRRWGKKSKVVWRSHTYPQCGKSPLQAMLKNPHYFLYLGVGIRGGG